jgi:hypothetical protein
MLLSGEAVRSRDAVGWLVDAAAPFDEALTLCWAMATGASSLARRALEASALSGVPTAAGVEGLSAADGPLVVAGREAIAACVARSCAAPVGEALALQARIAAEFLAGRACCEGRVGMEAGRVMGS